MAVYHDIEEISYGPQCGLPAIARVFLCIRHKLLRDGLGQKSIGHSFIMEKTGLTKAQVINSAKKLQKQGLILIKTDTKETAFGNIQYLENKYELNPVVFGEDYNWYQNNTTVRVYSEEKVGSYSRKGVSPTGIKNKLDAVPGVVSDLIPGVVSNSIPEVVSDPIPPNEVKNTESLENLSPNNPSYNNPSLKTLERCTESEETLKTGTGDFNLRFMGSGTGSAAREDWTKERVIDKQSEINRQLQAARKAYPDLFL